MRIKLPGWVTDNRTSVLREVAPYRDLRPEQRLEKLHLACITAAAFAEGHPDHEKILAHRDPLPRSSIEALARLRRDFQAQR